MIKIMLSGCTGKMGVAISSAAQLSADVKIVAGVGLNSVAAQGYKVFKSPSECDEKSDVVIDFSCPALTMLTLDYCEKNKLPLVIGTTGLNHAENKRINNAAQRIPVFYASNMSYGVFALRKIARYAAELLRGYDIELIESHHRLKADSPSGTAKTLLAELQQATVLEPIYCREGINGRRTDTEIGIHSVRGGTIAGKHEILFAGKGETITITHNAESKGIFAEGALLAARFLAGKPSGIYGMDNLINEGTIK